MTATALSQQKPTDFPQVPNITSGASRGGDAFSSCEDAQPAKFLISFFQKFGNWNLRKSLTSTVQRFAKTRCNGLIVPMRTALRLGDNFVHHFEFRQMVRSQLECLGGFGCVSPVSPQNRRTS